MKLKKLHIFLLFLAVLVFGTLGSGVVEGMKSNEMKSTQEGSDSKEEKTQEPDEVGGGSQTNYNAVLANQNLSDTTETYTTAQSSDGPEGVPPSNIPPGDEDLYILKSEIVPPVCPACPTTANCPRQKPCQPCPPCARCPEPAFDCKKVPNYRAGDSNYLPKPVLNDFGQFGM